MWPHDGMWRCPPGADSMPDPMPQLSGTVVSEAPAADPANNASGESSAGSGAVAGAGAVGGRRLSQLPAGTKARHDLEEAEEQRQRQEERRRKEVEAARAAVEDMWPHGGMHRPPPGHEGDDGWGWAGDDGLPDSEASGDSDGASPSARPVGTRTGSSPPQTGGNERQPQRSADGRTGSGSSSGKKKAPAARPERGGKAGGTSRSQQGASSSQRAKQSRTRPCEGAATSAAGGCGETRSGARRGSRGGERRLSAASAAAERLADLNELRDAGFVTEAEYEAKRDAILATVSPPRGAPADRAGAPAAPRSTPPVRSDRRGPAHCQAAAVPSGPTAAPPPSDDAGAAGALRLATLMSQR